ncbi:MAG TPA: EAL domain-containing protein [Solirubrobacteraceae bacterium]
MNEGAELSAQKARGSSTPGDEAQSDGILRLGIALSERVEDVVEAMTHRTRESGNTLESLVEDRFCRVGEVSTMAVARWMAGEGTAVARELGYESWQIFGQLAAQRAVSLNEVTKQCLRWRDAAEEVVRRCAVELELDGQTVSEALSMLQRSLDVTLVRMCESFESERQRADAELHRRQEELAYLATHDALTGLPNRTLIQDRMEQMLVRSRRHRTPVAALFIDLDNFKSVNDTLGHSAGDQLLQAVATRLKASLRDMDALGRLGGDEFVVLAEEVSLIAGPELIAERLLEAFKEPFELSGQTRVTVSASIGIAAGERASAEELLRDADIAVYRAKWAGRNRYVVFESGMQDAIQSRMELEMDLREALSKSEFSLVYQPTFSLKDMRPTGVEALMRWHSPTRGLVAPNDFIPLLEETGLIVEAGRWALREACGQCQQWRRAGHQIGVAVNVSARQLDTDQLIEDVRDALSHSGLQADALTLEITETTLMRNVEETALRLTAVKRLGVRIAIDDFGTGYSSFAHLQKFPVDALKIDRSFVSRLTHERESGTLVQTLVQLGKALSIETLGEGIERQHELALLRDSDCDSGQGFLYAKPLAAQQIEDFLCERAALLA